MVEGKVLSIFTGQKVGSLQIEIFRTLGMLF